MNETPIIPLDMAVHACFQREKQQGLQVVAARPYGASSRSRTARVTVQLRDGSLKDFFLRCINSSTDARVQAEFDSLQRLYAANPDVVPRPHKWGEIQDENNVAKSQESRVKSQERKRENKKERKNQTRSRLVYGQVEDSSDLWPHTSFYLARIHQVSATTGKFGSDIPRHIAGISFPPAWYPCWADCFTSWIIAFLNQDIAVNGRWREYEAAFNDLISKTIPRLLLPLQKKGRRIVPSLIHGNLSANHIGIRFSDAMTVLFSPCVAYAHREYELGVSQLAVGGLDKTYVDRYLRIVLPSEPIDEIYHRIILYGIHFNLGYSISHRGQFRERIYSATLFLNGMYAGK